jgi:hypothetical protein
MRDFGARTIRKCLSPEMDRRKCFNWRPNRGIQISGTEPNSPREAWRLDYISAPSSLGTRIAPIETMLSKPAYVSRAGLIWAGRCPRDEPMYSTLHDSNDFKLCLGVNRPALSEICGRWMLLKRLTSRPWLLLLPQTTADIHNVKCRIQSRVKLSCES